MHNMHLAMVHIRQDYNSCTMLHGRMLINIKYLCRSRNHNRRYTEVCLLVDSARFMLDNKIQAKSC